MLKTWLLSSLLAVSAIAGVACSSTPETEEEEGSEDALIQTKGVDAPIAVPAPGTVLTELSQVSLMAALEQRGLHFAAHFGETAALDNRALGRAPLYAFIARDIEADLDAQRARDPKVRTQVAHGVTRILDKGWLTADYARFELTGVVPRFDRMAVTGADTCGEVRFLYRLAYARNMGDAARVSYSRLPVIMNVVYDAKTSSVGDCATFARAWQMPSTVRDADAYVDYVARTIAAPARLSFKQIELNAQVLRMPSESKQDMGGVAEYAFRIYGLDAGAPTLRTLENTPDVPRLEADGALRAELAAYLVEHAAEVDLGTLVLPAKFLATKVSAFSTFGSSRLVNKPFSRLFWDANAKAAPALAAIDTSRLAYVGSAAGLVARLDDMTCAGCHQGGRSIAGFHFLGEDSLARSHALNVTRVGKSPHVIDELDRRASFMRALAGGAATTPFRPMAFAASQANGKRNAPCLMPAVADAFKNVGACGQGLTCTTLASNPRVPVELGQCLPSLVPAKTAKGTTYATEFAGLPCIKGVVTDAADPRQDTMTNERFACPAPTDGPGYTCRPPGIGVPGGLCTQLCGNGNVARDGAHELCAYAGGKEFDECADRNDFSACLAGAIKSGLREACDEATPCREDWICQRFIKARSSPPEAPADGRGFCVPTYFLFQVRVDGHPNPTPTR